jgi:hypothetical protein
LIEFRPDNDPGHGSRHKRRRLTSHLYIASSKPFREALKRTCSQTKVPRTGSASSAVGTSAQHVMSAQETTPILNGNGHAGHRRYSTFASIFAKDQTPGEHSKHLFVRWPARGFTITKITLLSNYVNILLIFVPLGIIAGATGWNPTTVFVLNFFAIIPLAAILSFATEEISIELGETLGGLLNATFGNAVELIVCLKTSMTMSKLLTWLGEHCSSKTRPNPDRSIKHARQYSVQHSLSSRNLFCLRRNIQYADRHRG